MCRSRRPAPVPREEIDAGFDEGGERDLNSKPTLKILDPGGAEWIALDPSLELSTRLLAHKSRPDGRDVEYFHVDPSLRGPIQDRLQQVRVFPYYSFRTGVHALWIVRVIPVDCWYESLAALFRFPADYFAGKSVRVFSDQEAGCYRVQSRGSPRPWAWPGRATGTLLAEALGAGRFILTPDHPLYRDLADGTESDR